MIGTTLGHFRITTKLGQGGMGEVYRAEDTRLGRDVAVKVLPAAFTADPDRLARFEREARVLASLSHPAIARVFDVGHQNGTHFLVMELVGGETLAERIARGPLPLDEALPIALQMSSCSTSAWRVPSKGTPARRPRGTRSTPRRSRGRPRPLACCSAQPAP